MGCALDAADTPVVGSADLRGAAPLLRKIRNIGWLIGRYGSRPTLTPVARPSEQPDSRRLLVIGASAGGYATLAQLLRDIPLDFPAGIVLVQHGCLVCRRHGGLAQRSGAAARQAGARGRKPAAGQVLLAGTDDHLHMLADGTLRYRSPGKLVPALH